MRDAPRSVMIFAAGFGTRMMPLTRDLPKPMIRVAGRPLIDHALDLARAVTPETVAVNLHYKPEPLAQHLNETEVIAITEAPEILDTGGGLRNALPVLGDGPVWTLNPDVIWRGTNPLELLKSNWRPADMDALLLCINPSRAEGTVSSGDFTIDRDGRLIRGSGLIYGGAQIIRTEGLETVSEKAFSLNTLWDQLIDAGRCFGIEYPGHWCDVGHPGGIALAERLLTAPDV